MHHLRCDFTHSASYDQPVQLSIHSHSLIYFSQVVFDILGNSNTNCLKFIKIYVKTIFVSPKSYATKSRKYLFKSFYRLFSVLFCICSFDYSLHAFFFSYFPRNLLSTIEESLNANFNTRKTFGT